MNIHQCERESYQPYCKNNQGMFVMSLKGMVSWILSVFEYSFDIL